MNLLLETELQSRQFTIVYIWQLQSNNCAFSIANRMLTEMLSHKIPQQLAHYVFFLNVPTNGLKTKSNAVFKYLRLGSKDSNELEKKDDFMYKWCLLKDSEVSRQSLISVFPHTWEVFEDHRYPIKRFQNPRVVGILKPTNDSGSEHISPSNITMMTEYVLVGMWKA